MPTTFFFGDGGTLSESAERALAGEVDAEGERGGGFGGALGGGDLDGNRAFFFAAAAFFGCAALFREDDAEESEEDEGSRFAGGDLGLARTSFDAGPLDGRRRGSEEERALSEETLLLGLLLLDFERFTSLALRWARGALLDFDLFLDLDRCRDFERRSTFT